MSRRISLEAGLTRPSLNKVPSFHLRERIKPYGKKMGTFLKNRNERFKKLPFEVLLEERG
jgi:hypothetical protein